MYTYIKYIKSKGSKISLCKQYFTKIDEKYCAVSEIIPSVQCASLLSDLR